MSGMHKPEAAMPVSRLTCHPDPVLCKRRQAAGGPQHSSPRQGQQRQQRQVTKLHSAQAAGPSHRPGLPQRLKQRRRGPGRAQRRPAHRSQGASPQVLLCSSAGRRRVPRHQMAMHHRISSHNSLGSVLISVQGKSQLKSPSHGQGRQWLLPRPGRCLRSASMHAPRLAKRFARPPLQPHQQLSVKVCKALAHRSFKEQQRSVLRTTGTSLEARCPQTLQHQDQGKSHSQEQKGQQPQAPLHLHPAAAAAPMTVTLYSLLRSGSSSKVLAVAYGSCLVASHMPSGSGPWSHAGADRQGMRQVDRSCLQRQERVSP